MLLKYFVYSKLKIKTFTNKSVCDLDGLHMTPVNSSLLTYNTVDIVESGGQWVWANGIMNRLIVERAMFCRAIDFILFFI
jgi:hypothetical protein